MKYIISVTICFLSAYLLGAFVELNLNIVEWEKSTRIFPGAMGMFTAMSACLAIWSAKK